METAAGSDIDASWELYEKNGDHETLCYSVRDNFDSAANSMESPKTKSRLTGESPGASAALVPELPGPIVNEDVASQPIQIRNMATRDNKQVDLFLLGKTGNGKSKTGNAILGREAFVCRDSCVSVTFAVSSQWCHFRDRIIKVVDGPGLFDTKLDPGAAAKKLNEDMYEGMALCPEGFHALVLVLKYGNRYTDEERQTLANLKTLFGENFVRDYCILIFTHGDSFHMNNRKKPKQFSDWCKEQEDEIKELFEECQYRAVLFCNCEEEKYETQLTELLALVDGLESNGARYTNELFKQFSRDRERMALENDFQLKENIQKRINLLVGSYDNLNNADQSDDELNRKLMVLRDDARALDVEIAIADKGTGVLNNLREAVTHIITSVDDKTSTLAEKIAQCAEIARIKQENDRKVEDLNTSFMNQFEKMRVQNDERIARHTAALRNKESHQRLNLKDPAKWEVMDDTLVGIAWLAHYLGYVLTGGNHSDQVGVDFYRDGDTMVGDPTGQYSHRGKVNLSINYDHWKLMVKDIKYGEPSITTLAPETVDKGEVQNDSDKTIQRTIGSTYQVTQTVTHTADQASRRFPYEGGLEISYSDCVGRKYKFNSGSSYASTISDGTENTKTFSADKTVMIPPGNKLKWEASITKTKRSVSYKAKVLIYFSAELRGTLRWKGTKTKESNFHRNYRWNESESDTQFNYRFGNEDIPFFRAIKTQRERSMPPWMWSDMESRFPYGPSRINSLCDEERYEFTISGKFDDVTGKDIQMKFK